MPNISSLLYLVLFPETYLLYTSFLYIIVRAINIITDVLSNYFFFYNYVVKSGKWLFLSNYKIVTAILNLICLISRRNHKIPKFVSVKTLINLTCFYVTTITLLLPIYVAVQLEIRLYKM